MPIAIRNVLFGVVLLACAWYAQAQDVAIVGARVVAAPDAEVIERGTVVVREGRIVGIGHSDDFEVPDGVEIVDGSGGTLVAGFWNSHVHFLTPETREPATIPADALQASLEAMLTRWGFTTVFDIASFDGVAATLRGRIESGEVCGPDILSVGVPFFPQHGTPGYVRELLAEIGVPSAEVADPEQARARATRQMEAGADGVKLFAGAIVGGETGVVPMRIDIASSVVDVAHQAGKPAFAHPSNLAGLEVSMASGVDVLAHTAPASGPWDESLVERLLASGIALVPTLMLFEVELRREDAPDEVMQRVLGNAAQQVRALHTAGGDILFGTDVGYIDQVDTRREFELLAQAGLDWRAILATLTTTPARRFNQADRKGRIAAGMQADLVLLDGDPAGDVTAFSRVRQAIRAGRTIYARAAEPPAP